VFRRGVPPPPAPAVTRVSPKGEGTLALRSVRISGVNFCQANEVRFGSKEAFILTDSSTSLLVEAPEGVPGTVDVTVTTPGGTSAISELDHFKYREK
jgi:hypothetical protein